MKRCLHAAWRWQGAKPQTGCFLGREKSIMVCLFFCKNSKVINLHEAPIHHHMDGA
ncbi:hypothetical protein CHELA20_51050 [Hyphomicrobiales bacterium]|nr:hypothetical protein CHELA20_51050 [Hyphomicrobiales bacterium]CAH1674408.1 hypothetical protein CHELA41_23960 [Hyphomicrobiales bacterium]